jgi:hypothetical protein
MTPGAIRAGKHISDMCREYLPGLDESNAQSLAQISDMETQASAMLETLEKVTQQLRRMLEECEAVIRRVRS